MHIKGYKGRDYNVDVGDLISDSDGRSGTVTSLSYLPETFLIWTTVGTELEVSYSSVSYVSKPEMEE